MDLEREAKNKINERLSRFVREIKIKDVFSEVLLKMITPLKLAAIYFSVSNGKVLALDKIKKVSVLTLNIKHDTIKQVLVGKSNEWNNEGQRSYNITRMFIDSLNAFKSGFVQYS